MQKHQAGYKDPRFTNERIRALFAQVAGAPLQTVLDTLETYSGLSSPHHRRQIAEVFGVFEAAPHWWKREPCDFIQKGLECGQCLGDVDQEFEDASRDRFWERVRRYTGCGQKYSLLTAAYTYRPSREARLVLRALNEVHSQVLGRRAAAELESPLLAQIAKDLAELEPMGAHARRELQVAAAEHRDADAAEALQEAMGLFDGMIGEAADLPLRCQAECGRFMTEVRRGARRREAAVAAANALCALVARGPAVAGGLAAWCRRHFAEPGWLQQLGRAELAAAAWGE